MVAKPAPAVETPLEIPEVKVEPKIEEKKAAAEPKTIKSIPVPEGLPV